MYGLRKQARWVGALASATCQSHPARLDGSRAEFRKASLWQGRLPENDGVLPAPQRGTSSATEIGRFLDATSYDMASLKNVRKVEESRGLPLICS